jgi:hypothetical protein
MGSGPFGSCGATCDGAGFGGSSALGRTSGRGTVGADGLASDAGAVASERAGDEDATDPGDEATEPTAPGAGGASASVDAPVKDGTSTCDAPNDDVATTGDVPRSRVPHVVHPTTRSAPPKTTAKTSATVRRVRDCVWRTPGIVVRIAARGATGALAFAIANAPPGVGPAPELGPNACPGVPAAPPAREVGPNAFPGVGATTAARIAAEDVAGSAGALRSAAGAARGTSDAGEAEEGTANAGPKGSVITWRDKPGESVAATITASGTVTSRRARLFAGAFMPA